jgi:hypothetical protein
MVNDEYRKLAYRVAVYEFLETALDREMPDDTQLDPLNIISSQVPYEERFVPTVVGEEVLQELRKMTDALRTRMKDFELKDTRNG